MRACFALAILLVPTTRLDAQTTEVAKLYASDASPYSSFGGAVAVSGSHALIGASGDDLTFDNGGAVYHFERTAHGWVERAKLVPPDVMTGDQFGRALAIDGDLAVVGAPWKDGVENDVGVAYVYERIAGSWTLRDQLHSDTPAYFDRFGLAVAIHGETVVVTSPHDDEAVSASGACFVFERESAGSANWVQAAKLKADDAVEGDVLGTSVALDPSWLVVGGRLADGNEPGSGAAYVFARSPASPDGWAQAAKLTAPDGEDGDDFGVSVALSGETILVGASDFDGPTFETKTIGTAYVFRRTGGSWVLEARLKMPEDPDLHSCGRSVSLEGDRAMLGCYRDYHAGPAAGSAFVFGHDGSDWSLLHKIVASDAGGGDWFGGGVALVGSEALIGAAGDDDMGMSAGSAYVVPTLPPTLHADSDQVPLSSGGVQGLQLDAGPTLAGQTYLLLGSTSGTFPGTALGVHVLPLEADDYTSATLASPNAPPLAGSFGALDANGEATASFTLPTGLSPSFAGLVVNHAFLVLCVTPPKLAIVHTSNPVPLLLIP